MMEHIAESSKEIQKIKRWSAISPYECDICYQGYYCMHPFCRWLTEMMSRLTRNMNLGSSSCRGMTSETDKRSLSIHHYDGKADQEFLSGANEEKVEDEVTTVMHGRHTLATESLPPTVEIKIQEVFLRLGFSHMMTKKLAEDEGKVSP